MQLTDRLKALFIRIYHHQVLTIYQAEQQFQLTFEEIQTLLEEDYLEFHLSYRHGGALSLRSKAVHLVYDWLEVSKDEVAWDGTLIKRNRPRPARLKPIPNTLNRQIQLNEAVFYLMKQFDQHELLYHYYDYKHLPDYLTTKPHGFFQLNSMDIYLYSVDRESVYRKIEKELNETLVKETNALTHERPRLVLYLTADESSTEVIRQTLNRVERNIEQAGLTLHTTEYKALDEVIQSFILPSEKPTMPLHDIEAVWKLYHRLNYSCVTNNGKFGRYDRLLKEENQFYCFVDFRLSWQTSAKITIHRHYENQIVADGKLVRLLVLLPDETPQCSAYDYIQRHLGELNWDNSLVYFTTPHQLIHSHTLKEASFQFTLNGERKMK